jgi:hypothetical protein
MKRIGKVLLSAVLTLGLCGIAQADEAMKSEMGKMAPKMSEAKMIKLALSAAPKALAKDAGVMLPGDDGQMKEVKKGTNGFTCIVIMDNPAAPEPLCMDEAAGQWGDAFVKREAKPTNTVPGVAYMARGGTHYMKDGKIVMDNGPGVEIVKEPPHWMLMWPFDSKATGLPVLPNPSGVYIMFDGTPFSHLMIYQDPNKIK